MKSYGIQQYFLYIVHKIIINLSRILLNNAKRNDIMNPLTSFTKTIHTKGRGIIMEALKRVSPEKAGIHSQSIIEFIQQAQAEGIELHSLMI